MEQLFEGFEDVKPKLVKSRIYDIPDEAAVELNDGSWVYVGRRGHPPGWHQIASTSFDGTLLTRCGITGYGFIGDTDKCVPCDDCLHAR